MLESIRLRASKIFFYVGPSKPAQPNFLGRSRELTLLYLEDLQQMAPSRLLFLQNSVFQFTSQPEVTIHLSIHSSSVIGIKSFPSSDIRSQGAFSPNFLHLATLAAQQPQGSISLPREATCILCLHLSAQL